MNLNECIKLVDHLTQVDCQYYYCTYSYIAPGHIYIFYSILILALLPSYFFFRTIFQYSLSLFFLFLPALFPLPLWLPLSHAQFHDMVRLTVWNALAFYSLYFKRDMLFIQLIIEVSSWDNIYYILKLFELLDRFFFFINKDR